MPGHALLSSVQPPFWATKLDLLELSVYRVFHLFCLGHRVELLSYRCMTFIGYIAVRLGLDLVARATGTMGTIVT